MKHCVFGAMIFLAALCAKKWWDLPPTPPSEEAQTIVESMQALDGWSVSDDSLTNESANVRIVWDNSDWPFKPPVRIYIKSYQCSFNRTDRNYVGSCFWDVEKKLEKLKQQKLRDSISKLKKG
jgi:hypothetical protein